MFENIRGNKTTVLGTVIAVDPLSETVKFCASNEDGSALLTSSANYKVRPFDQEFFDRLGRILKQQMEKSPEMDIHKASIILPDQLFLLDMVSVPVIHRKAMQQSLSLAIESIYQNAGELNLMTYAIQQNKQTATYGLVGIRRDLLDKLRQTFEDHGVSVTGVTYASNAMVNGAMALNPKIKSDTFLLLDIKQDCARFAFVVRGCTMGYYDLPFGHGMMYKSRLAAEDTLFDHRAGELLVLNAKERARAKQLTMEGIAPTEQTEADDASYETDAEGTVQKGGRKLPKFMQRPVPQSREEYVYENFRIFLKWALELINNNREIVSLAKLDTVYVNMPDEYRFLFDIVSKKHEGRGISFVPLLAEGMEPEAAENLELYGGFFLNRFNEANTF